MSRASYSSRRPISGSPIAEDQLDRLGRLDAADEPGQDAEHAALGATRHLARRWRLGIEAAVARPAGRVEHRRLAVEAEDAAVDVRLAQQHAGVVDQVARREIVGAVDDDVVGLEDVEALADVSATSCRSIAHVGVDGAAGGRGASRSFGRPTSGVPCSTWRWRLLKSTTSKSTRPMRPTPAAARYRPSGEPSPPAADEQHLAGFELLLPLHADFGHDQVAAVAEHLVLRKSRRLGFGAATVTPGDRGTSEIVSAVLRGVVSSLLRYTNIFVSSVDIDETPQSCLHR